MQIYIPNEHGPVEKRVALVPEVIEKLKQLYPDVTVNVAPKAGDAAGFTDDDFTKVGAKIEAVKQTDIFVQVGPTTVFDGKAALHVGFLDPLGQPDAVKALATTKCSAIAMERIPRISRAQSMDALSSQSNLGGYKAVLAATEHYMKALPLMMTAAGSVKPAKVIILGVGVAGLQAIATARRLGAQVEAFDIRPETKEQVQSLGAKFIEFDLGEEGTGEGGYARALTDAAKAKQQQLLQEYLATADIVITTALIPGREAPELITEAAVKNMKHGSVIVDMAAAAGGNCKLTEADKVVIKHGVTLVGHTNYPSQVANTASTFYARNILALLQLLLKHEDGKTTLQFDMDDEIIKQGLVVHNGEVC